MFLNLKSTENIINASQFMEIHFFERLSGKICFDATVSFSREATKSPLLSVFQKTTNYQSVSYFHKIRQCQTSKEYSEKISSNKTVYL